MQHEINKLHVSRPTSEGYRLKTNVDLLKLKQAISDEFQHKTDDLINEARSREHFMDGYMRIIKSIETSKQRNHEMRARRQELEDEITLIVQQRSLNQIKFNALKQDTYEIDATAEMTLTKELEEKKAELAQI